MRERGLSRVARQLAAPAALGLVIGVVLAFQSGTSNSGLTQIPLGTYVTPTASNAAAGLSSAGPAAGMRSNTTCDLIVPADPLSARGLATPYQLTGPHGTTPAQSGCTMSNGAKLGAFVQATILDPATGALSVYEPLVITKGTRPDTPGWKLTPPAIPPGAVVTLDFGFNGQDLVQVGATPATLADAHCAGGQTSATFGKKMPSCNRVSFFNAVRQAERSGRLTVPSPGTSTAIVPSGGDRGTGRSCPVISNFEVAGLNPGPSVTTTYLLNPLTGQTAPDNATYRDFVDGATLLHGRSANQVLDQYIDPILGCQPFQAPDLSQASAPSTSEALDQIAADAHPPRQVASGSGRPQTYCQNLVSLQAPFLAANQKLLAGGQSPVTATASNLLTFLAHDLSASFTSLGCQRFHLTDPVTLKQDHAGAAIAATFDTAAQTAS
jgi:hypothetical protein